MKGWFLCLSHHHHHYIHHRISLHSLTMETNFYRFYFFPKRLFVVYTVVVSNTVTKHGNENSNNTKKGPFSSYLCSWYTKDTNYNEHTNNDCSEREQRTFIMTTRRWNLRVLVMINVKVVYEYDTVKKWMFWGKVFHIFYLYTHYASVFVKFCVCGYWRVRHDEDKRKSAQLSFCVVIRVCRALDMTFKQTRNVCNCEKTWFRKKELNIRTNYRTQWWDTQKIHYILHFLTCFILLHAFLNPHCNVTEVRLGFELDGNTPRMFWIISITFSKNTT